MILTLNRIANSVDGSTTKDKLVCLPFIPFCRWEVLFAVRLISMFNFGLARLSSYHSFLEEKQFEYLAYNTDGYCDAVTNSGSGLFSDVFQCNSKGGCCDYGPRKSCAKFPGFSPCG